MARTWGSMSKDDLSFSAVPVTLSPAFAFVQVVLQKTRYPSDVIFSTNKHISAVV